MMPRVYVGNLPDGLDEEGLRALFVPHGEIVNVTLADGSVRQGQILEVNEEGNRAGL